MQLPKHMKMMLAILNRIAEKGLQSGDRLPSEREIMEIFSLSRGTVRHALTALVDAGYLRKMPKSGYYLQKTISEVDHTANLGFLIAGRSDRMPEGFFTQSLYHSIPFQEAGTRGFEITAKYSETVNARLFHYFSSCAGLLLTDWVTDEWVKEAKKLQIPLCCIGNNLCRQEKLPTIDYDYTYVVQEIMKRLHARGCRKTVMVLSNCDMPSAHIMEKAYRETLAGYGIPLEERRIVKLRYGCNAADMMEGLSRNGDCDAVICPKLPNLFQYQKLGWTHNPEFALTSGQSVYERGEVEAIYPTYKQDIYLKSADMLIDHILLDKPLPDLTLIRPEICDPIPMQERN